ncbi:hypothetical protein BX070DRAFT_232620 [Coemansia spiralis]|nr:hypothetical protein BX070DRAFT_232620 [Coemansia spiralis]
MPKATIKQQKQALTARRANTRTTLSGRNWDESTLEQRRRARLQRLERENYTAIPEFDNLMLTVDNASHGPKRPGRPRSSLSAPKPNASTIVIGTGEEGLKRVNRKDTQLLALQKKTLADIISGEAQSFTFARGSASNSKEMPADNPKTFYYMTCTALPALDQSLRVIRRHFCSICGYKGLYTCVDCGVRYCSLACKSTHTDTRCLKHVV